MLMVFNDAPYGSERTYNGMRLALNLLTMQPEISLSIFLMGDSVTSARTGQQTPSGYYNLERMLKSVLKRGGKVLLCGTCMDARGLREPEVVEGSFKSTLDELTRLTLTSDKVLIF
jgi:uncharacterized protein involved in oxidation of intracellular sulfur